LAGKVEPNLNSSLQTIMTMIKNHPVADVIFGEGLKLFPNITMFKNLTVYEILWGKLIVIKFSIHFRTAQPSLCK